MSSSAKVLLMLALVAFVHCIVEEEPTPSTGGAGGGGEEEEGSPGGARSSSTGSSSMFGYVPFTNADTLGHYYPGTYCDITPLKIDSKEFDKRCGPASDTKWPCFSHNGESTMQMVTVEPWSAPLNMSDEIVLKDDKAAEFTLRNATDEFTISYPTINSPKFKFYGYEPNTGCYKIHLSGTEHGRIHVTLTEDGDAEIDTKNVRETGKRLCSKWIYIGTRWRDTITTMAEDDGRGI
ncbi:hypothetical protein PHBOTO_003188 [Pseudozyma hubeiensis]|nr:hypothetical protein PHBOTO_003188 [Pseudozyma hubeiensis]